MSEPNSLYSFSYNNGDGYFPLPPLSANPAPTILIGDKTLYTLATFCEQILNNNLNPRFAQDMFGCGVKTAGLPSYLDGYVVAQSVFYKLHPQILTTTGFNFPLLSISEMGMKPVTVANGNPALYRTFNISWIMPPLTAGQSQVMATYWSYAAKTLIDYITLGYDPKVNPNGPSCWITSGIAGGEWGNILFTHSLGSHRVDKNRTEDLPFPTMSATWSCWEINQLGVPQNYASTPLTSIYFQGAWGNDGYNATNPLQNIADGYAYPNLTISSIYPESGSAVNGDTLVYVSGTGFLETNTYTITFNGAVGRNVVVQNDSLLTVITNPSVGYAVGTGNVVISDQNDNTYTATNVWTYT
jgi:hypothetical protein